jgi:hypothetical protein
VLDDPVAIDAIGECSPEDGQVVLRARVLDVGQELAPRIPTTMPTMPLTINKGCQGCANL